MINDDFLLSGAGASHEMPQLSVEQAGSSHALGALPVVRAHLTSTMHGRDHRRIGRDIVWSWARKRWPQLMPDVEAMRRSRFERVLPGKRIAVTGNSDADPWMLEVTYDERDRTCSWTTRAMIAREGEADVFALETFCTHAPDARPLAPPAFLRAWVSRIPMDDAGVPVLQEPRVVDTPEAAAAFIDHLLLPGRALPVIALVSKPQVRYYGVDPRGVAESVCGLAHVACLTADAAAAVARDFGRSIAPAHGVARVYMPGFSPQAVSREHPVIRLPAARPAEGEDAASAGAVRRLICRKLCGLSVAPPS